MWYDIWYDMIWYICQLQLGWYPVAVLQYTFTQTIQRITQWNRVHRIHKTALRASNHSMDILNASRFWQPSAATALYHTRRSHHSVVSSWWWAWNCPKHVEQFIKRNQVLHKLTSSWFCYLHCTVNHTSSPNWVFSIIWHNTEHSTKCLTIVLWNIIYTKWTHKGFDVLTVLQELPKLVPTWSCCTHRWCQLTIWTKVFFFCKRAWPCVFREEGKQ